MAGRTQARLALDEDKRLALVEGVVAEGHDVGAGEQDLVADRLRDAEAAGRVLAVDDDEIEPPALAQGRQALDDRVAARPADDVAEEEEAHRSKCSRDGTDHAGLRDDQVEPPVMRLGGHARHFLHGKGKADRDDRMKLGEGGDGAVVMALAVAEAVAGPVESGERHEQRRRKASGASGPGSRMPKPPRTRTSPGRQSRQLNCGWQDQRQGDRPGRA